MEVLDLLQASLLDLLYELRGRNIRLTIGGGYGLYLKQRQLRETRERTMLQAFPEVRSTNDLDLFLRTEVLADPERARVLAEALSRLGCEPVEGAKYLQFVRNIETAGGVRQVKFDLLTGPPYPGVDLRLIRRDSRRWRPRGERIPLHAHPTPEAVGLEEELLEIRLHGRRTTGEEFADSVYLPQTFTYALMKLTACRDRIDDPDKDLGRHHALDLYTIVATATEQEWETALRLYRKHQHDEPVQEACRIVRTYFCGPEALGTLRLREHPLASGGVDLEGFLSALRALLPHTDESEDSKAP
jgi:hypothetical protein